MQNRISKWGNSLAVRLPKEVLHKAGIKMNQIVQISQKDNGIFIEPVKVQKASLAELLSKVTEANSHKLIEFGAPVGKEIW